MKIGIFGGGFGLYGYVPASLENGWEVHTLEKYRSLIDSRPEIRKMLPRLVFHQDENQVIQQVQALVCARTPQLQIDLLERLENFGGHLFLEKPLAPKIVTHEQTLNLLRNRHFSVAYLFPYTDWFQKLRSKALEREIESIEISWRVQLTSNTWKSDVHEGGGIADYFGIHFIPLFDSLGVEIQKLEILSEPKNLDIILNESNQPRLKISLSIATSNHFQVKETTLGGVKKIITEAASPFGASGEKGKSDPRIPYLSRYMETCLQKQDSKMTTRLESLALDYRRSVNF